MESSIDSLKVLIVNNDNEVLDPTWEDIGAAFLPAPLTAQFLHSMLQLNHP